MTAMNNPVNLRPGEEEARRSIPTSPSSPTATSDEKTKEGGSMFHAVWDVVRYALIAALIIIPIRIFIAQPFIVQGRSMYPTFKNNEYLIVDELTKRTSGYTRGDVVILHYPNDPSQYYIKRVIGLPSETVTITDGKVFITKPGEAPFAIDEPYVKNPKVDSMTRKLSDSEYFVMGDNRAQSSDSRAWGPVPARLMDGKALIRLFPPGSIEYRPGGVEKFTTNYPK